jgi:hypothetical protein
MLDNPESLLDESHFEIEILANKIIDITKEGNIKNDIYKNLQEHFIKQYTCKNILEKVKNIL